MFPAYLHPHLALPAAFCSTYSIKAKIASTQILCRRVFMYLDTVSSILSLGTKSTATFNAAKYSSMQFFHLCLVADFSQPRNRTDASHWTNRLDTGLPDHQLVTRPYRYKGGRSLHLQFSAIYLEGRPAMVGNLYAWFCNRHRLKQLPCCQCMQKLDLVDHWISHHQVLRQHKLLCTSPKLRLLTVIERKNLQQLDENNRKGMIFVYPIKPVGNRPQLVYRCIGKGETSKICKVGFA